MRLKEARETGAMFYTGKVCAKHPELLGQRRAKSGNCHLCVVERMKEHRAKNRKAYNRKHREWQRAVKSGKRVTRKYRYAKEKATGVDSASG